MKESSPAGILRCIRTPEPRQCSLCSRCARDREQSRPRSARHSQHCRSKCQWWEGNSAEESTARAKHQNFTAGYSTSVSEEHFSDKIKHFLSRSEQRNVFCNEFVIFCTVRFDNLQYFVT